MNKSTFFIGQPIFSQLLSYLPKRFVDSIASKHQSDYYTKRFTTYDHLVTLLFSVFNNCDSLREIATGLQAWEGRISHLGIDFHPRRSTISDANKRRNESVFEFIYNELVKRNKHFLSDSRRKKKVYIFDSTTISLFKEILSGTGLPKLNGKQKGGIKVHTLMDYHQNIPCMVRFSSGTANDSTYLKFVEVPKGSVVVFDRGYPDYRTYNRFSEENITWVTRLRKRAAFVIEKRNSVSDFNKSRGITSDENILLGHEHNKQAVKVMARIIRYRDPKTKKEFCFLTNNFELSPFTVTQYYKRRWKIELLFKQLKQNYPLKSFLGDNENAIKVQIWATLIANVILQIIKNISKTRMSFSNIVSMVRVHLCTYIHLLKFIIHPEKALTSQRKQQIKNSQPQLFDSA